MKPQSFALALAMAPCLLATPALARNSAWYVGGDFGGMLVQDVPFNFGVSPTVSTAAGQLVLNHDYGYDGALFVGYDLGAFRLEAEVSYKRANVNDIDSSIVIPPVFPTAFTGVPGLGNVGVWSFMGNGIYNIYNNQANTFGVFGGVGLGFAQVKYDVGANSPSFIQVLDSSNDSHFAWQVVAGVRQAVTDNIDVTLRYRFFNTDDIRTVDFRGREADSRFRSHSLLGGITFNFGAPPPPPPPPPPPNRLLPPMETR